jgi:phosphoribosylaminoimidazole (AIR) synthetase
MYRVFNMGIGFVVFLPAECDLSQLSILDAVPIGEIKSGTGPRLDLNLPEDLASGG